MSDDPKTQALVALNDANAEPWWQSGVGVFGAGGALYSLGFLLSQVGAHGTDLASYDLVPTVQAAGALIGFLGVLYRRYMPGLKPMFHTFTKG